MATSIKSRSIWAAAVVCSAVLAVPASAEAAVDSPPSPVLPAPLPLPVYPVPAPPIAPLATAPGAIGSAEMDPNGTIRLHLRAPMRSTPHQSILPAVPPSTAEERLGYGEIELDRWDLHYRDMLRHLGGLRPGQVKPVPPWRAGETWHCALDPERGPCPLEHLLPGGTALR